MPIIDEVRRHHSHTAREPHTNEKHDCAEKKLKKEINMFKDNLPMSNKIPGLTMTPEAIQAEWEKQVAKVEKQIS